MNKKKVFFVFLITLLVITFNYLFFQKIGNSLNTIIGSFSDQTIETKALVISFFSQWLFIIVIGLIKWSHLINERKIQQKIKQTPLPPRKFSSKIINTEIDSFYDLINRDKELPLKLIAKRFNISKDLALEWAKILENQNLAKIDYPAFGEAKIKSMKEGPIKTEIQRVKEAVEKEHHLDKKKETKKENSKRNLRKKVAKKKIPKKKEPRE